MDNNAIFDERYRVIAIDEQNLILRGIRSGDVLTIVNADPENPLTAEDYPPGKLIALLGVKDLIVVDTKDALLIADRNRAQEVGELVRRLEKLGREDLL